MNNNIKNNLYNIDSNNYNLNNYDSNNYGYLYRFNESNFNKSNNTTFNTTYYPNYPNNFSIDTYKKDYTLLQPSYNENFNIIDIINKNIIIDIEIPIPTNLIIKSKNKINKKY